MKLPKDYENSISVCRNVLPRFRNAPDRDGRKREDNLVRGRETGGRRDSEEKEGDLTVRGRTVYERGERPNKEEER